MRNRFARTQRGLTILMCIILLALNSAIAGPPLICHTFDIGSAKSLPWISHSWNLTGGENYDTSKLVSDTVAILVSNPTVLVHMETLRRATLYTRKDPAIAKELLTKLTLGTKTAPSADAAALHYFDVGYLAQTYKQWIGEGTQNPAHALDGYALVKQAIQLRPNDAQMQFAAALITLSGPAPEHQDHAQKAIAGAKNDPLLARNLASHFMGEQSQTIAEMLTKPLVASESKQ